MTIEEMRAQLNEKLAKARGLRAKVVDGIEPDAPHPRGARGHYMLNADQHRRLAALLRKGTAPDREKQALHHEQLAAAIDQREQDIAEIRAATAEALVG